MIKHLKSGIIQIKHVCCLVLMWDFSLKLELKGLTGLQVELLHLFK